MENWALGWDTISALGTVVAAVSFIYGFRQFRMQMNAQTFLDYTKRYNEIMACLPFERRLRRYDADAAAFLDDPKTVEAYLKYFNMCSEEFYLWKEGYLQNRLWQVWEGEMRRVIRSALGGAAWDRVEGEFESFPAFKNWMREARRAGAVAEPA